MRAFAKHMSFLLLCLALVCIFLALRNRDTRQSDTPVPAGTETSIPLTDNTAAPPVAREPTALPDKVDFNFHIRPILSDRCFTCHGPDKATLAAELQLSDPQAAFVNLAAAGEPNRFALVAGAPEQSEVVRRISSKHPDLRMPPEGSNKEPLSELEQQLIRQWIQEGAEYKPHWAFIPPVKPALPTVRGETCSE